VSGALATWLDALGLESIDDADLVAGRFLRHCRHHAAALRRARSARLDRVLHAERRVLAAALAGVAETGLVRAAELASALADVWTRAHAITDDEDAARAQLARLAAEALDDACGHLFAELYRRRGRWLLAPGEPYPPLAPDLVRVFGKELITHPAARGDDDVDRTARLALAPDSGGLEVEVSFANVHELPAPAADARVAVILPIAAPSQELAWDDVPGAHVKSFFGVRPKDPAAVAARACDLLDEASARRATIAVLPELCLDERGLDAIRAHQAARGWPFDVVAAGSVHTHDGGLPRNLATMILRGGAEVTHAKFNPFSGGPAGEEAIATHPARVSLHVAADERGRPAWSYSLLVCKDLLSRFTRDVLAVLRPGLVLVPAWSSKTTAFELDIQGLVSSTQSAVVLANQADPGGDDRASVVVVARPTRAETLTVVRRGDAKPPQALVFQLGDGARVDDHTTGD
jgi:predicted amidohydrolase